MRYKFEIYDPNQDRWIQPNTVESISDRVQYRYRPFMEKGVEESMNHKQNTPKVEQENMQPNPVKNDKPAVWSLVMGDMVKRDVKGIKSYGTRLQPFNGRDALQDAYEEALDLAVYLRQAIYERDGK